MTIRILLVALGIAWAAALAGLVWMMTLAQLRPHHALLLLIDLGFVMKACVLLSVVSAGIGIVSLRAGARPGPWIGIGGALGWGVLGAAYGAAGVRSGVIAMNSTIPFAVYAQFYAEALIVLVVGLTGALLVLGLLSRRRPA
jgi:hypothetical protein